MDLLQIHETFDKGENREEDPYIRPSEIVRFKHAFYGVWAIGVMANAPYPYLQDRALAFLDKCGPRELCGLEELAIWAI